MFKKPESMCLKKLLPCEECGEELGHEVLIVGCNKNVKASICKSRATVHKKNHH